MSDLGEVFSDEPAVETSEEVETTETVETEGTTPETETTNTEETTEVKSEETKPEDSEEYSSREKAYLAQAKDERQKRQERDERIKELEAKAAEFDKEPEKRPDIFDDQEGYTESLRSEFRQEVSKAKLDVARDMMISFHDDYVEVEKAVLEEIQGNPFLKAELQNSSNVAKAVYDYGKKMIEHRSINDFNADEYKSKIEAETRAKLEAEYKAKYEEQAQTDEKVQDLSPSLANARGSSGSDEKEVTDLNDVFG